MKQTERLHWSPPAKAGLQDTQLARISQEVMATRARPRQQIGFGLDGLKSLHQPTVGQDLNPSFNDNRSEKLVHRARSIEGLNDKANLRKPWHLLNKRRLSAFASASFRSSA